MSSQDLKATGRRFVSAAIVALFVYIAMPLLLPVLMGGIFAVLVSPLLDRLERRKLSVPRGSALLTFGFTLLILLPTAFLVFIVAKTGAEQVRLWKDAPRGAAGGGGFYETLVASPMVHRTLEKISHLFPISVQELADGAEDLARTVSLRLADLLGAFFSQLPGRLGGLAITVVSMYFFLVDGRRLILFLRRHSVYPPRETDALFAAFSGMCRSVILATVLSGAAQAVVFLIAGLITRLPDAPLLSFLVFLGSFIPIIGSMPVTLGVVVHQFAVGHQGSAIFLTVVAVLVGLVDNLVRPWVLKGSANLHPLLAFVAAFGGLQTIGFTGVFLGPIIASLFVVTLHHLTQPLSRAPGSDS